MVRNLLRGRGAQGSHSPLRDSAQTALPHAREAPVPRAEQGLMSAPAPTFRVRSVYCSPEEWGRWQAVAQAAGSTTNSWIRATLNETAPPGATKDLGALSPPCAAE